MIGWITALTSSEATRSARVSPIAGNIGMRFSTWCTTVMLGAHATLNNEPIHQMKQQQLQLQVQV